MVLQISFVYLHPLSPFRHRSYGAFLSTKEIKASHIKPTEIIRSSSIVYLSSFHRFIVSSFHRFIIYRFIIYRFIIYRFIVYRFIIYRFIVYRFIVYRFIVSSSHPHIISRRAFFAKLCFFVAGTGTVPSNGERTKGKTRFSV